MAERRVALRLTQDTLAQLAGVSRSTVQAVEYGSGSVSFSHVADLAEALGWRLSLVPDAGDA